MTHRKPPVDQEAGHGDPRRLERAPGERYAGAGRPSGGDRARPSSAAGSGARGAERPASAPTSGRVGPAVAFGVAALLAVAVVWALAVGLFDVTWGLVIVGAGGGWLIGAAVSYGAWRGTEHVEDARIRVIAAACGATAWLAGSFGGYLVGLLLLPASSASLGERIANAPFPAALTAQFSLVDVAAIVLLAVLAWRTAR